jgi:hypothetical protein
MQQAPKPTFPSIRLLPAPPFPQMNWLQPEGNLSTASSTGVQNVSIFKARRNQVSMFTPTL